MRRLDHFHLLLFLFILWAGLSSLWSVAPTATFLTFATFFSGVMFCLALWDLLRVERSFATVAFAYVAGCYVLLLIEGADFLIMNSARIGDVISGPNYVAGRLIFAFPLAWYLVIRDQSDNIRGVRYFGALYIPLASLGIWFTRSRQGLVALAIAIVLLILMFAYENDYLQQVIALSFTGIISAPIWWYILRDRFQALTITDLGLALGALVGEASAADADLGTRFEIYSAGIEIFRSHYLLGSGFGSFPVAVEPILGTSQTPHSTYLAVATESGIIGLALFILIIFVLLRGTLNFESKKNLIAAPVLALYLVLSVVNTWLVDFTALFMLTVALLSSRPMYNDA